jgi:hypothetical protein
VIIFQAKRCDNRVNHIQEDGIISFCEKFKTPFLINPGTETSILYLSVSFVNIGVIGDAE